jgi:hypothetical protein
MSDLASSDRSSTEAWRARVHAFEPPVRRKFLIRPGKMAHEINRALVRGTRAIGSRDDDVCLNEGSPLFE